MSSNGATSMPRCLNMCQSNLTFCPTFSTCRASSSGFSRARTSASSSLIGQPALAEQALAQHVVDRDVAGLAGRDRQRDADEIGPDRIERIRLGVEGDDAGLERAGDPGVELRQRAHGRIFGDVEALGRARARRARAAPATAATAFVGRGAAWPAARGGGGGRRRRLAVAAAPAGGADEGGVGLDRADVDAADLADAPGDRGELHRLQERDQLLAFELRQAQRIQRSLQLDVAHQRDELLGDADQRRPSPGWSASRGAWAA